MHITIVLAYENARDEYRLWAHEEEKINFRKEKERATRCTVSYAALEMENYLTKLGFSACVSDKAGEDFNIFLTITKDEAGEEFTIATADNSLTIDGNGRVGVLYGVYEFLEKQGVYWLNPWEEIVPEGNGKLIMPEARHYRASFPHDRGYSLEGELKESALLWKWMARKKLNAVPCRPNKAKLQQKLGFVFVQGGHVFEEMLAVDAVLPSGATIWEEHPEWYGLPPSGKREKHKAQHVGFCVSQDSLLEYISEKLVERLNAEWYEVDGIVLWGFDTWGGICTCDACKKLGNGSDHTLRLNSYIRDYLDRAFADGRLDRHITISFSSYEGTSDLQPPENPVPENLRGSRDNGTYCPINRCYVHAIDDPECDHNRHYYECLAGWKNVNMRINEYYNVSKFEDLPFLFTRTMAHDFRRYHELGATGMVYMHLPMVHWDVKNLTQILYAELCWNVDADVEEILAKYFENRYGSHAAAIRKVYELMEEAGKYCANWRAWSPYSILSKLLSWDGCKPETELERESHLGEHAAEIGMESVRLYEEAIAILQKELLNAEEAYVCGMGRVSGGAGVNPAEQIMLAKTDPVVEHLRLDLNYANYGRDCMEMITLFVMYHEALRAEQETDELFARIDALAQKMMGYYVSIRYENYAVELHCYDALMRCQLKTLYYRCRAYRELVK